MPHNQNCKTPDCPRLAVSFSAYCGEHLPETDDYLALLSHEIATATTPVSLNLHHVPLTDLVVMNQTFDSPSIQQVTLRHCTFVNVQMDMGQLQNVNFVNCKFIRCHWVGIELSEFNFSQCRFHRCHFAAHCQLQHGGFDECQFYRLSIFEGALENVDFLDVQPSKYLSIVESSIIQVMFMRGELAHLAISNCYVSDIMAGYMALPSAIFDGVNTADFEVEPRYCDFRGLQLVDSDIDIDHKDWSLWNNFLVERAFLPFLLDLLETKLADDTYHFHEEIIEIALKVQGEFEALPAVFVDSAVDYFTNGYRYFIQTQDFTELGKFLSSFGHLKTHFPEHFGHARLGDDSLTSLPMSPINDEGQGYIVICLVTQDYSPAAFNQLLSEIDAVYQRISILSDASDGAWELLEVSRGSWVLTLFGHLTQLLAFKDTVDTSQIKLNQQQLLESKQKQQYYQLATLEKQLAILKKQQLAPQVMATLGKDELLNKQIAELTQRVESIQCSVYDHKGQLLSGDSASSKLNIKA